MAQFDNLIEELADKLHADLYPSVDNVVSMRIEGSIKAQIEIDRKDDSMIICLFVAELPPGKFREHILKDALKANARILENRGVLAFVGKQNSLILFQRVETESTSSDDIIQILKHLTGRAKKWIDAIDSGHASPQEELPEQKSTKKGNMFGL